MLTIIAIVSVWDSAVLVYHLVIPSTVTANIIDIINSLLLTITIIVLFETVAIYFRTKQVDVRILLIAGLTGMVRHILVYNMGEYRCNYPVCNRCPSCSPDSRYCPYQTGPAHLILSKGSHPLLFYGCML